MQIDIEKLKKQLSDEFSKTTLVVNDVSNMKYNPLMDYEGKCITSEMTLYPYETLDISDMHYVQRQIMKGQRMADKGEIKEGEPVYYMIEHTDRRVQFPDIYLTVKRGDEYIPFGVIRNGRINTNVASKNHFDLLVRNYKTAMSLYNLDYDDRYFIHRGNYYIYKEPTMVEKIFVGSKLLSDNPKLKHLVDLGVRDTRVFVKYKPIGKKTFRPTIKGNDYIYYDDWSVHDGSFISVADKHDYEKKLLTKYGFHYIKYPTEYKYDRRTYNAYNGVGLVIEANERVYYTNGIITVKIEDNKWEIFDSNIDYHFSDDCGRTETFLGSPASCCQNCECLCDWTGENGRHRIMYDMVDINKFEVVLALLS